MAWMTKTKNTVQSRGAGLAAQAAAVKAWGPKAPGTQARPTPVAQPKATRPLPAFMQGAASAAAGRGMPQGNAAALLAEKMAPEHTTAMFRSSGLQPAYGPVVGPRPGQFVSALSGIDGFSLTKLTNWVGNAVAAVASKDPASILSVAAAAIPGGKTPTVTAPPAPPAVQVPVNQPFYQQMMPQNDNQKWMMGGAAVLGLGLVALIVMRRR